jgi:hypothetical protein
MKTISNMLLAALLLGAWVTPSAATILSAADHVASTVINVVPQDEPPLIDD